MEAYVKPLDRLRESLRWFIAVPELKLMHVHTGPELRSSALERIVLSQNQPENRAAILVFTTPSEADENEWLERGEELSESLKVVAAAAANARPPVVLRLSPAPCGPGVAGFAAALRLAADALEPAFSGIIAVLAPEGVTEPGRWLAQLRQLFSEPLLARKVRFIVVETEPAPALSLAVELGAVSERVDVRLESSDSKRFLAKLLNGMKSAPPGADPVRIAGMAGPREAPPPRAGRQAPPPEVAAKELEAAGMSAAWAQPEVVKALRIETLSASLAIQDGRAPDAIRHQTEARDVADRAGLKREAALMQLMLGGYLLQAGSGPLALEAFDLSVKRAQAEKLPDLEAQSQMARGGALMLAKRPYDAAEAYRQGGAVAETQESKMLAIECYRTMGQILLNLGNENEAATAWRRAVSLAEAAPPLERIASSARIAAGDLATLYRKSGLAAQATALDQQVKRWEQEVPKPPADDPAAGASA